MVALLVYGTASADSIDTEDSSRSLLPSSLSVLLVDSLENTADSEMEEVMVIGKKKAEFPRDTLIDKIIRFNSKVEYFPGLKQPSRLARTERFSLHYDNGQSRTVQVFRVRFGG
ncbi:MAG: hypothetical protein AB8G18_17040 [Gammaproteobacteria bacterium]